MPPLVLLSTLALYSAYNNDRACIGGIAGGYLAFLLLWVDLTLLTKIKTRLDI